MNLTDKKQTLTGPGIFIELDAKEIYPSDPGQGTPAMVWTADRKNAGTFFCVVDTGEMVDGYQLTKAQAKWLAAQEDDVYAWLRANGG